MAEQDNYLKLEFYAKDENVSVARLAAASLAGAMGFSLSEIEEIKVAVSEAVSNAMIHGYCGDESRIVEMELTVSGDCLTVEIRDGGVGIADVEKAKEPLFSTVSERMGLGFVFMESFMDSLEVTSSLYQGTLVRMTKACFCK